MTTLPPERWHELAEVFRGEFGTDEMPDPERTEIRAEFDSEGSVMCFYLLERVVHAGPFYVAPGWRGRGLAREMAQEALRLTEGEEGYIAATRPEVEHLAGDLGLVRITGSLWCKEADYVRQEGG